MDRDVFLYHQLCLVIKNIIKTFLMIVFYGNHCLSFFLFAARTHVSYEVKDNVAVVRINDPNSKVCSPLSLFL